MGLLDTLIGDGSGGGDDAFANGASNFLGAVGAGLLTGNRFQPIGPGFGQRMDQLSKLAATQGDKASIAALLKLYGFSDQEALSLASNPKAAELAIAKKQLDTNNAQTADALANAPGLSGLFGGEGGGAAPRMSPAAPGGPAAGASLTGGQTANAKAIYDGVIARGGSPMLASAVVGNFAKESSFDPTIGGDHRNGVPTSFGLGQWREGRLDALKALGQEQGKDWRTTDVQLDHLFKELNGGDAGAARARALIEQARTPEEAAAIFARHFERPSAEALSNSLPGRQGVAAQAFRSFGQGGAPTQVADASGRIGAPAAASGGSAIQTELGPVAFTPSAVPQDPGTETRGDGRPADAAGINAARRDYFRGSVPPIGSGVTPPPPPPPKPLPGARRAVDVAETEDDVQRLEGRMSMYPPSVYGATPELQRQQASRAAEAGAADMPAPGAQPAGFHVPSADGGRGRTYTGTTALSLAGQQARAEGVATTAPPPPLEKAASLSGRRKLAAETYSYWSVVLAKSANNKPLAEFAKSRLDVAKEFLKPSDIEAKLDAAGLTGTDRQQAARNMLSDNRPANVQEYEYSRSNPEYEDFRERQRSKAEPNINAQAEQRRAVAASLGMDPNSPGYKSYVATGRMPNEDKPGPSASDKKVINQAEDEIVNLDNTLATLRRAKELNPQTYQGVSAKAFAQAPTIGQAVSSVSSSTQKRAEATREFQQIMSMEAIKSMSQTLKGATTDAEMARFMEILGDPSTPIEIRARTIDRMMTVAQRQRELSQDRARDLRGGTYYNPDYGRASGQPGGQSRQGTPAPARSPAPLSDLEVEARRRGLIQ